MEFEIRKATAADIPDVCKLVKELAEYEKMTDKVKFNNEIFANSIFKKNYAKILVAEYDQNIVAYAIYFYTFSTFLGAGGIYLEDVYVKKILEIKVSESSFLEF